MKLQSEIKWWLPFGLSIVYSGTPKTRAEWIRLTWRGYIAAWHMMFLVWKEIIRKSPEV